MDSSSCSFPHIFFLVIISFFLLISMCFAFIQPLCHNDERSALLQFKQNFARFDSACSGTFPKLSSWKIVDGNDNCCSWDRVECDNDTGYAIGLDLSNTCLYGSIYSNSTLFQLVHLQKLNLAHNNFNHSQIPQAIEQLSDLRYLNLSASQFSGQIPYAISKFHSLSIIDLSNNNFAGKFPEKIFQLQSLQKIMLRYNPYLYGYLPEFNSNNSLEGLWLRDTGFYGKLPFSIGNLLSLTTLNLAHCDFSGTIPFSVGNLIKLKILNLASNNFTGAFPSSFGNLTELKSLQLSNNYFNDTSNLPWLRKQSKLIFLGFSHIDLRGNKLSFLDNLTKLEILSIIECQIMGPFPSSIRNLSSLIDLTMSSNNMTGMLPPWLGSFSKSLQVLNIKNNLFNGSIPDTFGKENNLRLIDLGKNQLQGQVPRSLSNCEMLEILVLRDNQLNDTFPSWLGSLPKLRILVLRSNEFYGAIGEPKTDFEFPKLHIIDLSDNFFSKQLPSQYMNSWTAMKTFSSDSKYVNVNFSVEGVQSDYHIFYSMKITYKGSRRDFQRILEVFSVIDLSSNRFEGEIPSFIGTLKGLQSLNLSHNILVGKIPSSLQNMTQLESLDLSYNNLSGNIPPRLSDLTFLAIFNVSYNNLSGPIPRGRQLDNMENSSYEGNPGLCGTPLSNKCDKSIMEQISFPLSQHEQNDPKSFFEFGWKIVLIGYGCGMLFGMVVGSYIISLKQELFFKFLRMIPSRGTK